MNEPTIDEINTWKAKIEKPDFQKRLNEFQNKIFKICDDYRQKVGMRFIRAILPRHEVKKLESVVFKITEKREENPKYGFNDLVDLIGIKIFCPYLSSVETVTDWLYSQTKNFRIEPKNKKDAFRYYSNRGYKGYHFVVLPNLDTNPNWFDLKCEIQVKTMCQETWDAFTHEISYKRDKFIDPDLLQHMKQLSNVLSAIDEQGEIIKNQIEKLDLEEKERKDAAATIYLLRSKEILEELKELYDLQLSCEPPKILEIVDLESLNSAIGKYIEEQGISNSLCYFVALIAICQKEHRQEEMAILLATEYAENHPDDPRAELVRASVNWALNKHGQAIEYANNALKKAEKIGEEDEIDIMKNQLCYFVSEASLAKKTIKKLTSSLKAQALIFANELLENYPEDPGFLDTIGFSKIALGNTIEQVEKGLSHVRKARKIGLKAESDYTKRLSEFFAIRHERIAFVRLAELTRKVQHVCITDLS